MFRLSLALGMTPAAVEAELTAEDLATYQAMAELDGPWWCGEHVAGHVRELCSVTAAAAGASIPADEFRVEWELGEGGEPDEPLLTSEEGVAAFAALHGLDVVEVPRNGTVADGVA